jgi:hypothetical protein
VKIGEIQPKCEGWANSPGRGTKRQVNLAKAIAQAQKDDWVYMRTPCIKFRSSKQSLANQVIDTIDRVRA